MILVVMCLLEAEDSSWDDTLPIREKVYVIGYDNGTVFDPPQGVNLCLILLLHIYNTIAYLLTYPSIFFH